MNSSVEIDLPLSLQGRRQAHSGWLLVQTGSTDTTDSDHLQ